MNRPKLLATLLRAGINRMALALIACSVLAPADSLGGQAQTPLDRVRGAGLDSARVGRVTVHFASQDRAHAVELAVIAESAAVFLEREFGGSLPLHLAVLRPAQWFVPYPGAEGEPYGIPWGWVPESLMAVPASLSEGVLIMGPDPEADLRRVRFVMLHELGHLAAKRYLHPNDEHLYSSVRWFEELVATYFAYAFLHHADPAWAEAGLREWTGNVATDPPPSATLDWRFMFQLPPGEFAVTFAWYQNLINVRAAALHAQFGLSFLHSVRDRLPWASAGEWTTESLMPRLEAIAPGFERWATALNEGEYRSQ